MKYIRTKTFITDLASWMKVDGETLIIGGAKHEIVKQADTIEELIDGWVVRRYVMDEPCHWFYNSKERMKADISLRNPCYSIYGAIWTDKGLIYVAKINNKGELELL